MMFHFVSNINCELFLVLIFLAGCSASTSWADSQKGGNEDWWNLMNDQSISVRTHRKHWAKDAWFVPACSSLLFTLDRSISISISISHSTSSPILATTTNASPACMSWEDSNCKWIVANLKKKYAPKFQAPLHFLLNCCCLRTNQW